MTNILSLKNLQYMKNLTKQERDAVMIVKNLKNRSATNSTSGMQQSRRPSRKSTKRKHQADSSSQISDISANSFDDFGDMEDVYEQTAINTATGFEAAIPQDSLAADYIRRITGNYAKSYIDVKDELLANRSQRQNYSLPSCNTFIRQQRDAIAQKKRRRGAKELNKKEKKHSKQEYQLYQTAPPPMIKYEVSKEDEDASLFYLENYLTQPQGVQTWIQKGLSLWISQQQAQHQVFKDAQITALVEKLNVLYSTESHASFHELLKKQKCQDQILALLNLTSKQANIVNEPNILKQFITATEPIDDFKFVAPTFKETAKQFLVAICNHTVHNSETIKSGVVLFGWHIKAFDCLQKLMRIVQNQALLGPVLTKFYDQSVVSIIQSNPSNFLYDSVFSVIDNQLPESQLYLVIILSKLDISCDPGQEQTKTLIRVLENSSRFKATLIGLVKINLQISELLIVLQALKQVHQLEAEDLFKQPPNCWQTKSQGLQSGQSSAILIQTTKEESLKYLQDYLKKTVKDEEVDISNDYELQVSKSQELSDELNFIYKHSYFQAAQTAAIVRQPSEVNIISVITGSGKTWLAVHVMNNNIASRILIIVPDTLLLDQMETFMANLGGFFDYTIATIAQFFLNPNQYKQELVIIDEFDEFLIQQPFQLSSNLGKPYTGIWHLRKAGRTIYGFTASISTQIERATKAILFPEAHKVTAEMLTMHKFMSEYEYKTGKNPINIDIVCCEQQIDLVELICSDVLKGADKPQICFFNDSQTTQANKIFTEAGVTQLKVSNLANYQDRTTGVLLLNPVCFKGLNTDFAIPAVVRIGCSVRDTPHSIQMAGRSNRKRGPCHAIYYLNTTEDSIQVKKRLDTASVTQIAELIKLIARLKDIEKWLATAQTTPKKAFEVFHKSILKKTTTERIQIISLEQLDTIASSDAWYQNFISGGYAQD